MGGRGAASGAKGGRTVTQSFNPANQQPAIDKWLDEVEKGSKGGYSALELTDEDGYTQIFETYSAKELSAHIREMTDTDGSWADSDGIVFITYKDGRKFAADGGGVEEYLDGYWVARPGKSLKHTGIESYYEGNGSTVVLFGKGHKIKYDSDTTSWRADD